MNRINRMIDSYGIAVMVSKISLNLCVIPIHQERYYKQLQHYYHELKTWENIRDAIRRSSR